MSLVKKLTAAAIGLAALGAAGAAPGTAFAEENAPLPTECVVTGGTLSWGVKEAFRAYISGSIANGSWEVSDGAEYRTPEFTFTGASGSIDADTGEGEVSFAGSVVFTGHDEILNLQFANPTIRFRGDGNADLLLDAKSNNAQGELVVDAQQVPTARLDGVGIGAADLGGSWQATAEGGTIALERVPTMLTADGAKSFADFYATGDALDPISATIQLDACAVSAPVSAPATSPESSDDGVVTTQEMPDSAGGGIPWLPIGIAGAAIVVIAVAAGMLLIGRRPRGGTPESGAGDGANGGDADR